MKGINKNDLPRQVVFIYAFHGHNGFIFLEQKYFSNKTVWFFVSL